MITIEEAKLLMEKHDVKLIHGIYGFRTYGIFVRKGCAVSLLVLHHTDDVQKTCKIIEDARNSGALIRDRLLGILDVTQSELIEFEWGFEHDLGECPAALAGRALRSLVEQD